MEEEDGARSWKPAGKWAIFFSLSLSLFFLHFFGNWLVSEQHFQSLVLNYPKGSRREGVKKSWDFLGIFLSVCVCVISDQTSGKSNVHILFVGVDQQRAGAPGASSCLWRSQGSGGFIKS